MARLTPIFRIVTATLRSVEGVRATGSNEARKDHIITIEDPIEFVHGNKRCLVNQREVHRHTGSFKDALRAALREDPNIVLVGEMRDLETVSIAIETAETGHLVFGTLHTTTAASTVDRIIDQFPEDRQEQIRLMLSTSLKAVIAQTLCCKIGGGRIAALEILIVTSGVANLIREKKTFQIPSIMQTGKNLGMQVLNDELIRFARENIVESEEAYMKAVDKLAFVTSLNQMLLTKVQNGEITCEAAIQQAITKKDMLTLLDKSGFRSELKKLVKMATAAPQPMEALQ